MNLRHKKINKLRKKDSDNDDVNAKNCVLFVQNI
jgi:hypothetical protein